MKLFTSMAALAILVAGAASAQGLGGLTPEGGSVTLAFNFHDDAVNASVGENRTTQISGYSAYGMGGNFGMGFSLGYSEERYLQSFYDSRGQLGVHPYFKLNNGQIGAYAILMNEFSRDEDTNLMGVEGNFDFGKLGVEGYVGRTAATGPHLRKDNRGLAVRFEASSALDIYGFNRRDSYAIGYLALTGLGVNYTLPQAPIMLTGELSKFHGTGNSLSDSRWDQFSLMATWVFGGEKKPSVFHQQYSMESYWD